MILCLTLGADKQHTTACSNSIGHGLQRTVQSRNGLGQIDNVDVVACTEDVRSHLRIPPMGLMPKVGAGFKQLTHRKIRQCHGLFSGLSSADK